MELPNLLEFVNNFHAKILEIAGMIETTHEFSEEVKKKWEKTTGDLRERLAKEKSFRRKDFDKTIGEVFEFQNGQEKNIRTIFNHYIDIQKKFSEQIKSIISKVEATKANSNVIFIQQCISSFNQVREEIEKKEVLFKKFLENYLSQQRAISNVFHALQKSNGEISPKDFKLLIIELCKTLESMKINNEPLARAA